MKQNEIIPCLTQFFIDNAETNQIHTEDLKKWVATWNDGITPDKNNLYNTLAILKSFLRFQRKDIFVLDFKKIDEFFSKHTERAKEYKEKKKGRV